MWLPFFHWHLVFQNLPFGSFDRDAPAIENDTTKSCRFLALFLVKFFSFFELIFKIDWIGSKKMKRLRCKFHKISITRFFLQKKTKLKQKNLINTSLMLLKETCLIFIKKHLKRRSHAKKKGRSKKEQRRKNCVVFCVISVLV